MTESLRPGERIDDLERSGLRIIQKSGDFCFGMDAVLLSGFVKVPKGGLLWDLGTGTGILPILLSAKTEARELWGIELQPEMADMAQRSASLNGIGSRVRIVCGDLRTYEGFPAHKADAVTSNPPYMKAGSGLVNPADQKALSRHEIGCTLEDVCRRAAYLLKSGGSFFLVHRPQRLAEIFAALSASRLEPKRMKLIHPFRDREANMVLIEAVRDGKPGLKTEMPVIVYESPGVYTKEIYDVYGY